jgi:sialic acid synthase SpsE
MITVVAEIGQNHNGDLLLALDMCTAARDAGVDVVKFQKRTPSLAVPKEQQGVPKDTPWGKMTYLEYRERLEFGIPEYVEIDRHCSNLGIAWTVSVWDEPSFELVRSNFPRLPFYKIPSACLTDDSLLEMVASTEVPVVLSTGMSTLEEVKHAVDILGSNGLVLCHCNSTYPCPKEDLNLRVITSLKGLFPDSVMGYSGHEVGLATTVAAVALGAQYIERHITLDRSMWGTDQSASVEPNGFKRLVDDIRAVEASLGDGVKRVTDGELEAMKKLRRV